MSSTDLRQQLALLPCDWRLVRVGPDKAPIAGEGWFDLDNYSPDEAAGLNGSMPPAWGLKSGPASGVLVLDLDSPGWEAAFERETGHPFTDLPRTIAWSSGKPGRSAHAFAVDPDWWPYLRNRVNITRPWQDGDPLSRDGKKSAVTLFELRWDRHQAVVIGKHPETGSYSWLPNHGPADIPDPAPAPDWLLSLLEVQELPDVAPVKPTAGDADRAGVMLGHLPAEQFSDYSNWLRVGMALHHTDPGLLTAWIDWCRPMAAFDEAECLRKWDSFGKGHRGRPVTIATLHHLATQHGYREPKRAERPPAAAASGPSHGAAASVPAGGTQPAAAGLNFEERWAAMEAHADAVSGKAWPTMKAIASLSDCARGLGLQRLTAHNLEQLLEAAQRRQRPTAAPLLPGARFPIRATPWAVDGVFRHGLNLLVGQPGAGKSRLSAAAIAAWLRGDRSWLGREMPCDVPALERHALIIGTDQPLEDWSLTLEPVGLVQRQATGDAWLHPRLTLHPLESGTMLDADGLATIRRWCDAHPHGVVLVDSLAACLPPGIDEDKAAVARPIHALAEAIGGCWALLTHHSRKAAGRDQNLGVGAGRGSSAIDGAVSRVIGLGLIHKMESGVMTPQESDPRRELLSTKRGGATLHLIVSSDGSGFWSNEGSAEDLKRQERRERTIAGLTEAQSAVLAVLDEASGWLTGRQVVEGLEPGQEYDNRGALAASTRKVLKRLEVIGLVETTKVGRDRLYRLSDAGGDREESQESHPSRDEVEVTGSNGSNAAAQRVWPALLSGTVGSDRLYSGPEPPEPVAEPDDWLDEFGPEPPEPVRATGEPAVEQAKPVAPQHESQESHPVCDGSGEPVALLLSPSSDRIETEAGVRWHRLGFAPQPAAASAPIATPPALPSPPMATQPGLL